MKWPNWEQAAIAAVVSTIIAAVLRRRRGPDAGPATGLAEPLAGEFALISALYSIWRLARKLPLTHKDGAIERARSIVELQDALFFPTELWLQQQVLRSDVIGQLTSWYYALLHVPALIAFLIWLFVRHRDHFPHWRNGLAAVTAGCLFIRFVRVAPPRFLVDLGYIDLSEKYGPSIYGPVGTGVSDQFAAMPSIHVGWAAVVSFGAFAASTSKWRWVALSHVFITALVVSATGHHWWLDGIVAVGLLAVGLVVDSFVRRRWPRSAAVDTPDDLDALDLDAPDLDGDRPAVGSSGVSTGSVADLR